MTSKFFMTVLVPWSIFIPLLIGLIKIKKLPLTAKIIWYYLIVAAMVNFAATFIGRKLHQNNLPLVHIYTAVEFIFFVWFYKKLLNGSRQNNFYTILPICFIAVCILNAIFFQSIYTYSSYTRSVEAIICLLFALNYFAKLAAESGDNKTSRNPDFYFNIAIFLYFSGAFMLFIFSNLTLTNIPKASFFILWVIHAALNLCMYLIFSIGFLLCKK